MILKGGPADGLKVKKLECKYTRYVFVIDPEGKILPDDDRNPPRSRTGARYYYSREGIFEECVKIN